MPRLLIPLFYHYIMLNDCEAMSIEYVIDIAVLFVRNYNEIGYARGQADFCP